MCWWIFLIKNNISSQFSSLIFLSPTIEPLGFWEVLWAVGITNLIIKFLFMGIKCLILLLPFSLVTYRVQVRVLDFYAADYSLKLCLFCNFFFFHFSFGVSRDDVWCWQKSWVRYTRPWLQFRCGSATWWRTKKLTAPLDLHWGSF